MQIEKAYEPQQLEPQLVKWLADGVLSGNEDPCAVPQVEPSFKMAPLSDSRLRD